MQFSKAYPQSAQSFTAPVELLLSETSTCYTHHPIGTHFLLTARLNWYLAASDMNILSDAHGDAWHNCVPFSLTTVYSLVFYSVVCALSVCKSRTGGLRISTAVYSLTKLFNTFCEVRDSDLCHAVHQAASELSSGFSTMYV